MTLARPFCGLCAILIAVVSPLPLAAASDSLFAPPANLDVGTGSGGAFLLDLNHDGHLDLITTHLVQKRLSVMLGDGHGHFTPDPKRSLSFDEMPGATAFGDLNHDGTTDMAVAMKVADQESIRIYFGASSREFKLSTGAQLSSGTSTAGRDYKPGLRLADLNEDGNLDLIYNNGRAHNVYVFLGSGHGEFGSPTVLKMDPNQRYVEVGDVDGDGHLDLVTTKVVEPDEGKTPGSLSIHRGDGKGGFAAAVGKSLSVPPGPQVAAIVDVNGDGRADLVLTHSRAKLVTILLNQGDGKFSARPESSIQTELPPFSVVAADVNGDKKTDLVVATVSSQSPFHSTLAVLLGDGQGGFSPAAKLAVGPGAYGLTTADVDEDGKPDIVSSSFEKNATMLLIGR
jgi:hypothetical protein